MKVSLKPGKYVVAVSGGVDSVVLLDVLCKKPGLDLIVAHFDHGIREDSAEDRKFVERLSKSYALPFEYTEGRLDRNASEATARDARYAFLKKVKKQKGAQAIITAHHQDDLLETAILNWLRGTGRLGLSSLQSTKYIKRPMLGYTKQQIINYAKSHQLEWREDSTNDDEKYLRNYVRRKIMPQLAASDKNKLLDIIKNAASSNSAIDSEVGKMLKAQDPQRLNRRWFVGLPNNVSKEVMASWLRANKIELSKSMVERLVVAGKTYQAGKYADVNKNVKLKVDKSFLALEHLER